MDIEKLQRITSLAKEFMHHKMASSMDDAVSMAEKQVYGEQPVTELKQGLQSSVVLQSPQQKQSEDSSSLMIAIRKLERVNQTHQRDISSMQQKMNEMISAINTLETQLKQAKQRPLEQKAQELLKPQANVQSQESAPVEQVTNPVQQAASAAPLEERNHARSGRFSSDDVCIEKIFYAGVR